MNEQTERMETAHQPSSLSGWIGSVLFFMNLLLTVLGSVMIFRYRAVANALFEDFDVEVPALARIALDFPFAMALPCLGVLGVALHFIVQEKSAKVACHCAHFVVILFLTTFFVTTALPVLHQLIDSLS